MSKYLNKSKSEMLTEVVRPKKIKDKKLIWKLKFIKRANEKIDEDIIEYDEFVPEKFPKDDFQVVTHSSSSSTSSIGE